MKRIPLIARIIFWFILITMIVIGLYGFVSSHFGQSALVICCGGLIIVVIVGIISENGMR